MPDDIITKDNRIYGGWRQPVNISASVKNSIHDDKTAQKLGMRGGTVAGNIHLEQFPPVLLKAFGPRWFERGSLSMYFTYATKDREDVRVVMNIPPEGTEDAQVETWMETMDGHTVCKGTASVGTPDQPTSLDNIELKNAAPEELRILSGLKAGDELPPREMTVTRNNIDERLSVITEPLDWYRGNSPWGGAIATPTLMFNAMRVDFQIPIKAVSFQGAAELRNLAGPVMVDVPYRAGGKILSVGASPKTEFYWFDAWLEDRDSGKRIAELRMMRRFMKASSPLYQDNQ